jgi:hypothetical protein
MRRAVTFALAALALAAPAVDASAEELNFATATAERPNVVLARTGLDHAFVLDLGYRRVVEWGGHQLLFGGDLALPWAGLDLGDFRVRASAAASLLGDSGRGWKLVGSLSPTLRATQNAAGGEHALGADLRVTGGYYGRWWLAGELGLDWAATTHIEHGRAYQDTVYADAKDGWYGNPGGTLYAGLNTGVSIQSVELVLRVGVPRTMTLAPQTVPFFALVGVNITMPR